MNHGDSNPLCLECGLCCNSVIFATGQLQPGDDRARLAALGLELLPDRKSKIENGTFKQPCAVFEGCRCRIYADRPQYCRDFECLLLKRVKSGRLEVGAARRVVRTALQRAEKVRRLLRELGDADESAAVSVRFRWMKQRVESGPTEDETAERFSQLTLAVHDLNVLLSEAFYPGPA